MTQQEKVVEHVESDESVPIGGVMDNWEFLNRVPTTEEVLALLKTLPPVWGVEYERIADFVQGLPATKKTFRKDERGRKIEEFHEVVTLYVSVAGRIKMAQYAAEENGWKVEFIPEPNTPTGAPGFLQMDDRLVYREYVQISNDGYALGSKPGMAWVPSSGGKQAAGSNPYEKVETAARGRALAAWGFGILPGSGIASLEEMQGARQNANALAEAQSSGSDARKGRDVYVEQALTLIEEVRQARGKSTEQMYSEIAAWSQKTFGKSMAVSADDTGAVTELGFTMLKDGQVQLVINAMQKSLQAAKAEEPAL